MKDIIKSDARLLKDYPVTRRGFKEAREYIDTNTVDIDDNILRSLGFSMGFYSDSRTKEEADLALDMLDGLIESVDRTEWYSDKDKEFVKIVRQLMDMDYRERFGEREHI